MDNNGCKTKPDIDYPCSWQFKVIGGQSAEMEQAICWVVGERDCFVSFSRSSSGGKFQSLNLEMIVDSEEDRDVIYKELVCQAAIKMVL